MESFLKEQLKRIQELTEKMSRLESHAAELSREMQREPEHTARGPLAEVRDLRMYRSSSSSNEPAGRKEPSAARDTSRRRRRRRR